MAEPDGQIVYIGVDGGGSRCRVRVRDHCGRLVGAATGGAANVHLDFDGALIAIRAGILAAFSDGAVPPTGLRLGLGLAGAASSGLAGRVTAALADFGPAIVTHDGDIACLGAYAGKDGGLVIAGTGSAGVMRIGGRMTAIGGRGFLMGDDGSGARLGLEAWKRALRAQDGFEPHGGLSRKLMAIFGDDPGRVVQWAKTARSSDFAEYVPLVLEQAGISDPLALDLVQATARSIVEIGDVLLRHGAPCLALTGGMAAALHPYLPGRFRAALREPVFDALDGALLLAGCPLPNPAREGGA